jgi:hypothetical protein
MESASKHFLTNTTRGFYRHSPSLSFFDRSRYEAVLAPVQQAARNAPIKAPIMTQQHVVDRFRKKGWKLVDNLFHADTVKNAKVLRHQDGRALILVVYPDASVDRVESKSLKGDYRDGWFSPTQRERERMAKNAKMPVGQRRIPPYLYPTELAKRIQRMMERA